MLTAEVVLPTPPFHETTEMILPMCIASVHVFLDYVRYICYTVNRRIRGCRLGENRDVVLLFDCENPLFYWIFGNIPISLPAPKTPCGDCAGRFFFSPVMPCSNKIQYPGVVQLGAQVVWEHRRHF